MKKEEKSPVNIKLEDSDDPQSPSKRKNTNEDCSTSQYSPYSYNNGYQDGGGGNDRSPSSYTQQGMMVSGYHGGGGGGYNYPQGSTQQSTVSSTTNPYNYNNIGQTWNGGENNSSDPLNLRNDFHQLAMEQQQQPADGGGNLQVQMQIPVQNHMMVAPHLSKQVDMYQPQQLQDPSNRRLSNGSVKGLTPRRG
ncbi:MAG: hypothetical protein AAFY76_21300, partial [Cyanobacteria bacterium J06649_11]